MSEERKCDRDERHAPPFCWNLGEAFTQAP